MDAGLLIDAEQHRAGRRGWWHIALALPKKAGSSLRLSQPVTRCGLMSASARIRPGPGHPNDPGHPAVRQSMQWAKAKVQRVVYEG